MSGKPLEVVCAALLGLVAAITFIEGFACNDATKREVLMVKAYVMLTCAMLIIK